MGEHPRGGDPLPATGTLTPSFGSFVDRLWLGWRRSTERPQALLLRPVPRLAGGSERYEDRVNRIGLVCVLGYTVLGAMATIHLAVTGALDNPTPLFLLGLPVAAFVPRLVMRNWGRWRGGLRGRVRRFAEANGLLAELTGDNDDGAQIAYGRLDDAGFCLFGRSVDARRSACHTMAVAELTDGWGVALQLEPKVDLIARLGQLRATHVAIDDEDFAASTTVSEVGPQRVTSAAAVPAILDEGTRRLIGELMPSGTVTRIIDGRLEAYTPRVHWAEGELESWTDGVRELRRRLQHVLSLTVAGRLLHLVMNERGDHQRQCLNALRDHFPDSAELEQAETFMTHAGGQLSLARPAEGGMSVARAEEGGLSRSARRTQSESSD